MDSVPLQSLFSHLLWIDAATTFFWVLLNTIKFTNSLVPLTLWEFLSNETYCSSCMWEMLHQFRGYHCNSRYCLFSHTPAETNSKTTRAHWQSNNEHPFSFTTRKTPLWVPHRGLRGSSVPEEEQNGIPSPCPSEHNSKRGNFLLRVLVRISFCMKWWSRKRFWSHRDLAQDEWPRWSPWSPGSLWSC